jgi:hypothetical protein
VSLPDPMAMGFEELVEYTQKLQEALVPFAHAGARCELYKEPNDDCVIYAERNDNLWELLAFDPDVVGEQEEDCRQLNVSDLKVAGIALLRK